MAVRAHAVSLAEHQHVVSRVQFPAVDICFLEDPAGRPTLRGLVELLKRNAAVGGLPPMTMYPLLRDLRMDVRDQMRNPSPPNFEGFLFESLPAWSQG